MAEIRAQETTVRITPPGTRIAHEPQDTDPEPPERIWRCDLNAEHDPLTRCGAEFSSYKVLSRSVSINYCPNCLSTFASRFSALVTVPGTAAHTVTSRTGRARHCSAGFATSEARTSGSTSNTFAPTYRTHDQSSRFFGAENTWLFAHFMQTDIAAASNAGSGWQLAIATIADAGSSVGPSNKKQRTDDQTSTDAAAPQKPMGKGKGEKGQQRRPAIDDQVLASIARLTLQGAQQHRTWEASLLDTFLFPTSSQTATSMKQARRAYHQEVQSASAGRRAELGPPHVHIYCAMVASLVNQMQAMSPSPDPLVTLSQQELWMNTATLQQMEAGVTMARVSTTRQEEVTRLQFRVMDEAIRSALRAGLCTTRARHIVGTAPPNHHERILARHLNGAQDMET